MSVITASVQTLQTGDNGAWFDVSVSQFGADVDGAGTVRLETRRNSSDAAPKRVPAMATGGDVLSPIIGPASVIVSAIAGRQYRFVCISGPVAVAADV